MASERAQEGIAGERTCVLGLCISKNNLHVGNFIPYEVLR